MATQSSLLWELEIYEQTQTGFRVWGESTLTHVDTFCTVYLNGRRARRVRWGVFYTCIGSFHEVVLPPDTNTSGLEMSTYTPGRHARFVYYRVILTTLCPSVHWSWAG